MQHHIATALHFSSLSSLQEGPYLFDKPLILKVRYVYMKKSAHHLGHTNLQNGILFCIYF